MRLNELGVACGDVHPPSEYLLTVHGDQQMNYALAAKLTVYLIIFVAAYLTVWPSMKRIALNLWKQFYEWFYSEEIATAREFNRLLRLDRLRKNLELADSVVDAERVQADGYTEMDVAS